jgi:hypothetical protein
VTWGDCERQDKCMMDPLCDMYSGCCEVQAELDDEESADG